MKREADLPIHSFLPATCPTYPILPHPTKPSPTENKNQKPKTKKRKRATANYPTSFLTFLYSSSPPPFPTIYKYLWSIATTIPIVIGKFEFHFSMRACMHKLPSHLTSCVPYTFHVLTHTVGKVRYLMYLYFLQSTLFVVVIANTHNIQHTG